MRAMLITVLGLAALIAWLILAQPDAHPVEAPLAPIPAVDYGQR